MRDLTYLQMQARADNYNEWLMDNEEKARLAGLEYSEGPCNLLGVDVAGILESPHCNAKGYFRGSDLCEVDVAKEWIPF